MLLRRFNKEAQPRVCMIIGSAALLLAIGLGRLTADSAPADFLIGMFYGISIAFNLTGVWLMGRQRRQAG